MDANDDPVTPEDIATSDRSSSERSSLYIYGGLVRKLFMAAGTLMLVTLPLFRDSLPLPLTLMVLAIVAVSVVAGLTNPKQPIVMALDIVVAGIGTMVFAYQAVAHRSELPFTLFIIDQILALLFFFALYFSTETVRDRALGTLPGQVRRRTGIGTKIHYRYHGSSLK